MSDRLREALEKAFPVFRMGGLTDAIYPADEGEGEGWALDNADYEVVAAAARRFLALTETGPDATAHLCESIHEDEYGFHYAICSCGEYRTAPVPDIDLLVDELMAHAVRAALADYLTSDPS